MSKVIYAVAELRKGQKSSVRFLKCIVLDDNLDRTRSYYNNCDNFTIELLFYFDDMRYRSRIIYLQLLFTVIITQMYLVFICCTLCDIIINDKRLMFIIFITFIIK